MIQKQYIRCQRSLFMQRCWALRWYCQGKNIYHRWKSENAAVVCGIELFRCLSSTKLSLSPNWIWSNVCNHVKTVVLFSLTTLPTLVKNHTLRIFNIIQSRIKILYTIHQCGSVLKTASPPILSEEFRCMPAEKRRQPSVNLISISSVVNDLQSRRLPAVRGRRGADSPDCLSLGKASSSKLWFTETRRRTPWLSCLSRNLNVTDRWVIAALWRWQADERGKRGAAGGQGAVEVARAEPEEEEPSVFLLLQTGHNEICTVTSYIRVFYTKNDLFPSSCTLVFRGICVCVYTWMS